MSQPDAARPGLVRQAGSIGVALLASSALGFVLLAVMGRWLSKADYAAFTSAWGIVFGFGSVIGAIEQEIARQATAASLAGRRVPGAVAQLAAAALAGTAVALGVLAVVPGGRAALGSSAVALLAFVALPGFAGQFLARGVFLGTQQTGRYVAAILAESGVRVAVAGALLLAPLPASVPLAVAAVVAGCFGWLPLAPALVRSVDWAAGHERWRVVGGRVGALAAANGLSAAVLTAFPTLVTAVLGTSDGLADLFGTVTASRVPLVLLAPLQALAVPLAVRSLHEGRADRLGVLQLRVAGGAFVAAAVLSGLGLAAGPWAMRVFLGPAYADVPAALVATVLASSAIMAGALLQAAVFVALQRYGLLVGTWLAADAAAVLALLAVPGTAEARGMAAFAAASGVAFVASGVGLRVALGRHRPEHPADGGSGAAQA